MDKCYYLCIRNTVACGSLTGTVLHLGTALGLIPENVNSEKYSEKKKRVVRKDNALSLWFHNLIQILYMNG